MRNPFRRRNWKQTEATVYTCGVQNEYDPGSGQPYIHSEYLIVFSYEIDGHWYSSEFTSESPRTEGSKFPLKYDADDPNHNEYSIDDAMNSLPAKMMMWAVAAVLAMLYIWFNELRHH